ncbi:MAG TPA: MOSC N-terminal beta barrel domain-containing protein [Candidimonas sp.]|nr:MOSC N-terminal beta barrel domain-containing protein [Candidimonas sp.]
MTSALYFPIAGCGGTSRAAAASFDRRWLIVDSSGVGLEQKACAKLAEIQVDAQLGYLVMRAEGMLRLDIPLEVIEDDDSVRASATIGGRRTDVVDEGELAATWVSKFLGRPCRLMKVLDTATP